MEPVRAAMRWELAPTPISLMEGITSSLVLEYASHPAAGIFIIVPTVVYNALLLAMDAPVQVLSAPAASTPPSTVLARFITSMALAPRLAPMGTSKTVATFARPALRPA